MILDRLGNLGIEGHITAPSIILGSPAGGDPGTGGVNLTALFLNGVQVTPPTVASTTVASSATPTPTDAKDSEFTVTALAVNATFAAPSGTPLQGHRLLIRITDNGTSRTLAWNAIYRASSDLALPTATTLGKTMYLAFEYNATASKWDFLSLLDNF
jgi:hypothetical protein